ncbi:MAG: caspase family protein [Nostoc sp.]|uniref:caspase family protein n=1 Tax=Nostoc sp. TaxID=1180 RepID=UPI002FFA7A55
MARVALLIGVSEYEPGLNPLPASINDMQGIAQVLQHPEMGGFAELDIQKLENPDPQKMQEAIETLFGDRSKDDLVVLYFSGHGIKDENGKLHLATRFTRKNPQGRLIKSTAVPASFVQDIMSESRSRRQVIILDCCFSGAFPEGWSAKDDGSVNIQVEMGGEGRVVLSSSTATQYSFEQSGENLSIYTRYLIEGIETGAADQDNDGEISIDELHEYAKKKVQEASPAMRPGISAFREGFKIFLAKAPIGNPKLRYRKEVEIYASRGEIPIIGRKILDAQRDNLGLLPEEVAAIEAEVLKPYQEYKQKLHQYEQALVDEIKREFPLSDYTRHDLERYQEMLAINKKDAESIETRLIAEEATHQPINFSEAPPSVQPNHRVEIPSQIKFSSSNQTTIPKAHNPKLKRIRWIIAVSCFIVVGFFVLVGLSELSSGNSSAFIGCLFLSIPLMWLGTSMWKP